MHVYEGKSPNSKASMVVLSIIGMPSIIDVCGYDREFCSSSPSSSSDSDSTPITQKRNNTVMKFCKNVDIRHPKRLVILISFNNK